MAIKKSFASSSIRKPGAYSEASTSPSSGSPLEANETLLLIGEADAGPGGASEGIQSYSASAYNQLVAKYKAGPLVDAAKAALIPSKTPGVGGAGRIAIYKTNASTQAELALATSYDTIKAKEYGVGGNRISWKNSLTAETAAKVSGSAAITDFAGLNGLTLEIRSNGGTLETVTFSSPSDIADVISQIDAQTTNLTASEDATTSDLLVISKDAIANHNRDGWGQSVEVVGGTALSLLFLTAGQFGTCATEGKATAVVSQPRDLITETNTYGGEIVLQIGRDDSDSCTAATVEITATQVVLTATGSDSYTFDKTDYPLIGDLVDAINAKAGWTASASAARKREAIGTLDNVAAIGCFSEDGNKPARIKRDSEDYQEMLARSRLIEGEPTATKGLPDALAVTNLAGGTRGASSNSAFDAGFTAALSEDVNVILPVVSRDASEDITDGLTDASSAYDIATVQAALDTHLRLRGNVKNRKEAQGWSGYRNAAKSEVYEQSATVNSELVQLVTQDVLMVDSSNSLAWKQPHVLAAMMAGIRLGTDVGEPLTHKYLNCQGIGHVVNASTDLSTGDFDPQVDYDDAIDAGVTFAERVNGGFRIVVDNTTYGVDANFVWNRGSVIEAAQYAIKTVRTDAELAFVGKKNAVVDAASVKSRIRSKLIQLFEDKILTASDDAPQGFKEDTFVVTQSGNTTSVSVEIHPVQGNDFILMSFGLGEATQSA